MARPARLRLSTVHRSRGIGWIRIRRLEPTDEVVLSEGLFPVEAARPWTGVAPAAPSPPRVTFRFAPPEVEERPLSVYEEVAV